MLRIYEKLESMIASETDNPTPRQLASLIKKSAAADHPTATHIVLYVRRGNPASWYPLPIGPDEPITKIAEAVRFKPDGKTAVAVCQL